MSEKRNAYSVDYISTRKITSSPGWLVLCVLLCLLAILSLADLWQTNEARAKDVIAVADAEAAQMQTAFENATAEQDETALPDHGTLLEETLLAAFSADNIAATIVSLLLIILFVLLAVFAWMSFFSAGGGLSGMRRICLIVCGISILYTAVSLLLLAYTMIDNSIPHWNIFGRRLLFAAITVLTGLTQSMFMIKVCRTLGFMRVKGEVANEEPLTANAILTVFMYLVIIWIGVLSLCVSFDGSFIDPVINFPEWMSGMKLPAWYTGFVYYRGSIWELLKTIFTCAVIICGGMCI